MKASSSSHLCGDGRRHQTLGTATSTYTHLLILVGLIMLSFDQLNPVKRLSLLVPDAADTSSIGWMMITLLAWAVLQDVHNVIYYCGRIFMHSLLSIFFSKVDVIGLKNIPTRGPLILAANHSNQFVDGICLVTSCPQRKVSILIAKKSYDNPIIGFFARAMAAVPVARPQDAAFGGAGTLVSFHPDEPPAPDAAYPTAAATDATSTAFRLVGGAATRFTSQLSVGDKISYVLDPLKSSEAKSSEAKSSEAKASEAKSSKAADPKEACVWKVLAVHDDHACTVTPVTPAPDGSMSVQAAQASLRADGAYCVLPRGDHDSVFSSVFAALQRGATIGIFPEGGSHDRTDLLDLKPGVALMALGAMTPQPVPIVPVGLSYFRGHLFRNAKLTLHFGPPIEATKDEYRAHAAGGELRRHACAALLERVQRGMRDVLVSTSSYEELQLIHVARRLWVGGRDYEDDASDLDREKRQDLDRRFAYGIHLLLRRHPEAAAEAAAPTSSLARAANSAASAVKTPLTATLAAAAAYAAATLTGADDAASRERALKAQVSAYRERELAELVRRLRAYDRELRRLGMRDSQVPALQRAPIGRTLFTSGHMMFMIAIASVPSLVLNAPVGLAAVLWARWKQRDALKRSDVKLRAHDVVLSEKMRFAVIAVPVLWLAYAVLLLCATRLQLQDVLTLLMAAPLASYVGVVSVESGMIALKDLRPQVAQLMYDAERVEALKREQRELRACVHAEVRKLVESDERVAEMFRIERPLSSEDWERIRRGHDDDGETH